MSANSPTQAKGPYKLVTVNTVPARAKIIIGRVVEALKDRYIIDYVANSESNIPSTFFTPTLVRPVYCPSSFLHPTSV